MKKKKQINKNKNQNRKINKSKIFELLGNLKVNILRANCGKLLVEEKKKKPQKEKLKKKKK